MPVWFARAIVVPQWMILFALIALLAPPFGATTGLLQLLGLALAYRSSSRSWYPPSWARCRTHTPLTGQRSLCCLRSMWIHGSG